MNVMEPSENTYPELEMFLFLLLPVAFFVLAEYMNLPVAEA